MELWIIPLGITGIIILLIIISTHKERKERLRQREWAVFERMQQETGQVCYRAQHKKTGYQTKCCPDKNQLMEEIKIISRGRR